MSEPSVPAPREPEGPRGPDLARAMLDAAKVRRPVRRRAAPTTRTSRDWSGPGPDARDPQPLGSVMRALVRTRGWETTAAQARLFGDWAQVVGPEVAAHCRPVTLEDGALTVEASSHTWAVQLRTLAGQLLKQIAAVVGHRVVTSIRVLGPSGDGRPGIRRWVRNR